MVAKGYIRNEWIDAYIADGDLSEVPEQYVDEVKARADARLSTPTVAAGNDVEIFDDGEK